jgi:hypothetical protein
LDLLVAFIKGTNTISANAVGMHGVVSRTTGADSQNKGELSFRPRAMKEGSATTAAVNN